ncbi:DUF4190 domain-containing protein [Streptomyces sp. NPDC046465]|uniref:DUF4190 domain-containing protein n=1 Tax=Streptomyces sp. NPDC046465 TaxID=3155810 RepID=UPI0033E6FD0A
MNTQLLNTQGIEMTPTIRPTSPTIPTPPPKRTGPAGAAMVLGIIGLSTSVVFIGGLLGAVGLVLGIIALVASGRTGVGRGKAITGVVTSALAITVSVLVAVALLWYADRTQECYQPDSFRQYEQCVHQQLTGD